MLLDLAQILGEKLQVACALKAEPKTEFGKWPCRGLWTIWQHEIVAAPMGLVAIESPIEHNAESYTFVVGVIFWGEDRKGLIRRAATYAGQIKESLESIPVDALPQHNDQQMYLTADKAVIDSENSSQSFFYHVGVKAVIAEPSDGSSGGSDSSGIFASTCTIQAQVSEDRSPTGRRQVGWADVGEWIDLPCSIVDTKRVSAEQDGPQIVTRQPVKEIELKGRYAVTTAHRVLVDGIEFNIINVINSDGSYTKLVAEQEV